MSFVFRCLIYGEGMAYGGLLFLGTGCPVPDVAIYWYEEINVWDITLYCFCIYSFPYDASVHGISFWKMDLTSYNGPPLFQIYITYSE